MERARLVEMIGSFLLGGGVVAMAYELGRGTTSPEATGEREAFIARSEGERQAAINNAEGEASAITTVASATAQAIQRIAEAIRSPGGEQAVQLKVAEKAVEAYAQLAQKNNTMIVPGNMSEVSALIGTAMSLLNARQGTPR